MKDGSGLENRIATAVAEAMGRKAQFVWLAKPAIYLVRDGLEKKTCDVVVGLDSDALPILEMHADALLEGARRSRALSFLQRGATILSRAVPHPRSPAV